MARSPKSGLASVKASEPVAAPDFAAIDDEPEFDGRPPRLGLNCPVTPLGINGKSLLFLDRSKQLQTGTTKCDKGDMMLWFGDAWLCEHFASKWDDNQRPIEWNQRKAQIALIEDCHDMGIFSPEGRVFGRGAHRARGNDEQLVLHLGNRVMLTGKGTLDRRGKPTAEPQVYPAGRVEDCYFPALAKLPPPADEASATQDAEALLSAFGRWFWVDDAAPLLLLGFVMQMFVCGALEWRSHIWLAGPTAAGKTSLQKIIRAVHDDWCLHTEDASEAALRQVLRDDTLPVLIDEAEAHDNPERLRAIVNLMKKASSGAKMYRGGADHKATEFTAQSCFLLSSVLHAPMRGEDRNRIVILDMRAVPEGTEPLELELAMWRQIGRKFHRRMIEQWDRFERTKDVYHRAITRNRFEGRWGDTYGTLLACADLALFDYGPDEFPLDENEPEDAGTRRVLEWVNKIVPLMSRGRVEARSDVERVQQHILTHMLPGAHGKPPESVGAWLSRAMALKLSPRQFETEPDEWLVDDEARAKLKSYGLRVVATVDKGKGLIGIEDAKPEDWENGYLAVAYSTNKSLAEVFRGSEWTDGVYIQSLGKIPGVIKGQKVRFAADTQPDRALLVPLSVFKGEEGEG